MKITWPKGPISWIHDRTRFVSIPFTWNLSAIKRELGAGGLFWDNAVVGGPAVQLLPDFFSGLHHVTVGQDAPGVLQRAQPLATRTTTGCTRHCPYCAIGTGAVEPGGLVELPDWPDLPIVCDNNLLAASQAHFDKVIDRLIPHGWADFNQGLDARLLTNHHAQRIAQIKKPLIRLALDANESKKLWDHAFQLLRTAGIALRKIRSYALIGFNDSPAEAWKRCQWIESHRIQALPMWFHKLDALEQNVVTKEQEKLGWTNCDRLKIMGYFYQHRTKPRNARKKKK